APSGIWLVAWARLSYGEFAIGTMWNHRLTRLKTKLRAVEMYGNNVRLERYQATDAANLGIGFAIGPSRQMCVTHIVVAAQALIGKGGVVVHEGQSGLIDVRAGNVPPWRKAGLVQDDGSLGIGNHVVPMTNHEVA